MFIYAYVFALVLGSILLGASFLLGADHDADHDFDGGADFDAGADLDLDADADADLDADHGVDAHGGASSDTDVSIVGLFGVLASMRFWTFFAAFFGLTGILLDGFNLAGEGLSFGLAVGVGFVTGWTAVTLIKRLSADDTGVAAGVDDYVGKSGEVLLPAGPTRLGKIRIELKGTTVDVLAESDDEIARGTEALIVEMRGSKALIVKLDKSDAAQPQAQA